MTIDYRGVAQWAAEVTDLKLALKTMNDECLSLRLKIENLHAKLRVRDAIQKEYELVLESIAKTGDHGLMATIARRALNKMRIEDA